MRTQRMVLLWLLLLALLVSACAEDAPQTDGGTPTGGSPSQPDDAASPVAGTEAGNDAATVNTPPAQPTSGTTEEGAQPTSATGSTGQTLSADAGRIAFMGPINDQGVIQAFVANTDGTGLRQASQGFAEGFFPHLSPDGSRVAFTAPSLEGDVEIFVAEVDGGEPVNLTNRTGQDQIPVWSPDGSQIAFLSEREGGDIDIWVMDADGSDPRRVAQAPGEEQLGSWSPDGTKIVFASRSELGQSLFIVDVATGEVTPLTQGEGREDGGPAWSPDGERIAYFSAPASGTPPALYTIRPDGSEETKLTDVGNPTVYPVWSPDGAHLGYTEVQPSGEWRLKAIELATQTQYDIPQVMGFMTSWRAASPLADAGVTQGPQTTGVEVDPAVLEAAYKKGDPNAPVTIIEFSDYQCPFCQRWFNDTLPQLESYIEDGTVQLIFVDFPLTIHEQAPAAAEAARCAGEQGGTEAYWQMHDTLFASMSQWSGNPSPNPIFAELAGSIGLDGEALQTCVDSGRFSAEVQAGLQEGIRLGVTGTPTFFINGDRIVGAVPFDNFAPYLSQ